jgi:hypothetical protein
MLAAAPTRKMPVRRAAAVPTEMGRAFFSGEVKRSMMRPRVKGTERETAEETTSCA